MTKPLACKQAAVTPCPWQLRSWAFPKDRVLCDESRAAPPGSVHDRHSSSERATFLARLHAVPRAGLPGAGPFLCLGMVTPTGQLLLREETVASSVRADTHGSMGPTCRANPVLRWPRRKATEGHTRPQTHSQAQVVASAPGAQPRCGLQGPLQNRLRSWCVLGGTGLLPDDLNGHQSALG